MPWWSWFGIGLFTGVIIGVFLGALLSMAGREYPER